MPRFRSLLFLLLLFPLASPAQSERPVVLQDFVVSGTRVHAADTEGHDLTKTYTASDVEDSGAFTVAEYLDTLPRAGGREQLVLIDGVPSYLDLSALSPGMIEGIEVSNSGALPQYGAYASGRVINVRLKKDYDGRELAFEAGGSTRADALRQNLLASGGTFRGRFRALYSVRYSRQDALTADARAFSRAQDHRAFGGHDFRVPWGTPATIQAVAGNLSGLPTAIALVPYGATELLPPSAYLPVPGALASGQRFFNTSPYLYLAAPSARLAANVQLTYVASPQLTLTLGLTAQGSSSRRNGPPPVTPASEATIVPAAFSPFGQDVRVGLVHTGFGPVRQTSDHASAGVNLGANGQFADTWKWKFQLSGSRSDSANDTRDLDPARFSAALAAPDPAARFNPFLADSAQNAALYPTLAVHRQQDLRTSLLQGGLQVNGPFAAGWGAGPLQLSLGAKGSTRGTDRDYRQLRGLPDARTHDGSSLYSLNAATEVPLLRDRPAIHRLDGRLAASYSDNDSGSATHQRSVAVLYSPRRAWLLRLNYARSFSSPGELDDEVAPPSMQTLMDPRRVPTLAENVQIIARRDTLASAGDSGSLQASISYEAPWAPGLRIILGYENETQHNSASAALPAQDVVDNERLFPDRVSRAAPTAEDILRQQPGALLAVDTSSAAVAEHATEAMNFELEYELPPGAFGRLSLDARLEHPLGSTYELASGQPYTSSFAGPANPPDWSGECKLQWRRAGWSASLHCRYTGETEDKALPAVTTLGLSVGYRFAQNFAGAFGRGVQLRAGFQNLIAGDPAYADTVLGYRNGSSLGTTFSLSARFPL